MNTHKWQSDKKIQEKKMIKMAPRWRLYIQMRDYCEFTYTLHINITTLKENIIEYSITLNYA